MGNWDYSIRSNTNGYGGSCKEFGREIVNRASGYASNLPSGYDYRGWYPYRGKTDAIRYAKAGEILQFTGTLLHTAIIISNFHDGRFEIVDSNWSNPGDGMIRKHVIKVNDKNRYPKTYNATMRSYVINSCH